MEIAIPNAKMTAAITGSATMASANATLMKTCRWVSWRIQVLLLVQHRCGSKVYDAGDQAVWLIPDTDLKMGRTDGAPTCWCQKIVALDQMYGQEDRLQDNYDDTYDCDNQQQDFQRFLAMGFL